MMDTRNVTAKGIRFSISEGGVEVARAYLYVMANDLHDRPFGLLEDVFVAKTHRGRGFAGELVHAVIERAAREGCYKLLAMSRNDGTRDIIHAWYKRLGFHSFGTEFRMDF